MNFVGHLLKVVAWVTAQYVCFTGIYQPVVHVRIFLATGVVKTSSAVQSAIVYIFG